MAALFSQTFISSLLTILEAAASALLCIISFIAALQIQACNFYILGLVLSIFLWSPTGHLKS